MMPQQTMVKRSAVAKMDAAIAVLAMQIAAKNNDINFRKAKLAKKLLMSSRLAIFQRYGNMARQLYVQHMNDPVQAKVSRTAL
jgi:hypothetical protein